MKITAIQTDLSWEDPQANLHALEEKITRLDETHILVLPEMFNTGFTMNPARFAEQMDGRTVGWMKKISAENRMIITGSLAIEEEGNYYNRLIWMLPDGTMGYYDKRHLFAYAGEDKNYRAGAKRLIASVNGWKINLAICYDLRFPVWLRQAAMEHAKPEYDILIVVANWPARRSLAWKTLLQARAIENQVYVIGVNRIGMDGHNIHHSGDSMIIGPLGEIISHAAEEEAILSATLDRSNLEKLRSELPFLSDRDAFAIHL